MARSRAPTLTFTLPLLAYCLGGQADAVPFDVAGVGQSLQLTPVPGGAPLPKGLAMSSRELVAEDAS